MKLLGLYVICALALYSDAKILKKRIGIPPIDFEIPKGPRIPTWSEITMLQDHFDPLNNNTWTMRYMFNDATFKTNGPMFIFLGGEWEISAGYLVTGQMYDMAVEDGGYMFYTEHRYYGASFPTPSLSSANLKYLSGDQALADVAYFIEKQRSIRPQLANSKVVVVGGSYSANLATWARLKYPHLVDAALSSSSPLEAEEDFIQYYEVVGEQIGINSQACLNTITLGTAQIDEALKTPVGKLQVENLLKTCVPIDTTSPARDYLFDSIAGIFGGLVQYAAVGEITSECNYLLSFPGTEMQKLTSYVRTYYDPYCFGDYNEFIDYYSDTALTNDATRSWLYQTCTEYGYYQTTNSPNQPFGQTISLNYYLSFCKDLYGVDFTQAVVQRAVQRTNYFYGGIKPFITQVVTVQGTVDPWHTLGILSDLSAYAPAMLVNGTSHCADLLDTTIPQLLAAKQRTSAYIRQWIS